MANTTALKMDIASVMIQLASPEKIRQWSYGEVKTQETINYRTLKPEKDGLFCERIFGTTKDWECQCGKFRSNRYQGVVCDRCGVEVTHSRVRRERMGSIELVAPVAHVWFYRSVPSKLAAFLGVSGTDIKAVVMYDKYIVIDPGETDMQKCDVISKREYEELQRHGVAFSAGKGAEAIKQILESIDLKELIQNLRKEIQEKSKKINPTLLRRLEIVEHFKKSDSLPTWMIMDVVPVLPPDLRPMVQLDGGRFASSDFNDSYRRVIRINGRVQKMISIHAPEIMIESEKRLLQQAVDSLFDNTKDTRVVGKSVKCLSDILRGKQGRFRQNLLGKRVDYSGRSVIVVGPDLKLHQCGVPVKMAMELFKPFIERKLIEKGIIFNIKRARSIIEQEGNQVFEVLDEVIKEHPVLLNRAPTLHRLGFQAFEPVLVEGKAIRLHPLVCHAYNADFDGDQMAIHVPLSHAAQAECWGLMLSARNLLNPANGDPIIFPSQDMVLGNYYLTAVKQGVKGEGRRFSSEREVFFALENGYIEHQALIHVPIDGQMIETTPGRIIFSRAIPSKINFQNKTFGEKALQRLISDVLVFYGADVLVEMLDVLKELGFKYATAFGATIGVSDVLIPKNKQKLISEADTEVNKIQQQYRSGTMTNEERYNRVVELWSRTNEKLTENLMEELKQDNSGFNPIYLMAHSGARGSKNQIRQLAGMRGLMAKPSGDIIELPIRSNFKEGLNVLEFFISTNGARKGLADTALKTADAGYLTRRLVDISQNVVVVTEDCNTINGVEIQALKEGEEIVERLSDRIKGRYALERVIHPITAEIIVDVNDAIDERKALYIEEVGIEKVMIRSILSCEVENGVCQKCYGYNLATNRPVNKGEAVGVIAAQSIGQPGTQLTMRTFHIGGVATRDTEDNFIAFKYPVLIGKVMGNVVSLPSQTMVMTRKGYLKVSRIFIQYTVADFKKIMVNDNQRVAKDTEIGVLKDGTTVKAEKPCIVNMSVKDTLLLVNVEQEIELRNGSELRVREGDIVAEGEKVVIFDIFTEPIICEFNGVARYDDILPGNTMREELNEDTGKVEKKIVQSNTATLNPSVKILDDDGNTIFAYALPFDSYLNVDNNSKVEVGQVLAKIPQGSVKTRDITGGLPRISKLFEAYNPKTTAAVLSKIDGIVKSSFANERNRQVIIEDQFGKEFKHIVPLGRHLFVRDGDTVRAGEMLCDGEINPHDILDILGEHALHSFLINEIQEVYRLQGVTINDKHIGIIIRQMMRNLEIIDSGDTSFIQGRLVGRAKFKKENEKVIQQGGEPAVARPCLLGVKKASVNVDSFLSAASFQETTKVLTNKAIECAVDNLTGLKENLILGQLIPAGTGIRDIEAIKLYGEDAQNLDEKVQKILEEREREKETIRQTAQEEEKEMFDA